MSEPAALMIFFAVWSMTDLTNASLLLFAYQRNHDFRDDLPCRSAAADSQRCLDDRSSLHLCDLRERDVQTAAAVTHHRVKLMEAGNDLLQMLDRRCSFPWRALQCPFGSVGTNSCRGGSSRRMVTGRPFIALVDGLKVALLDRLEFGKRLFTLLRGLETIISRIALMRSASKNICSVRHRPMPCAPKAKACAASFGVSAFVRTSRARN